MSKETRYNLIFLAVLLAVMVPGAVMLFRKKLDPSARPMYLPDPVRQTLAYMSPQETPPGMSRVAPPLTSQWISGMKKEIAGMAVARPRDDQGMPVTSASKAFEVVTYAGNESEGFRVLVVFWTPPPQNPAWSMQGQAGSVEYAKEVALPKAVREELGANGMLIPPKQVTFQSIRFSRPPGAGDWELALSSPQGTSDSAKIVQTFTSTAATSN